MNSTLKKINNNQCEILVDLGKEDLSTYVSQAEDMLCADFETKGFRKGKAPKEILRKELGAQRILEAALEIAVRDSLSKVIKENELDVVDTSKLEIKENGPAKLLYKVLVTTYPDIKIAELKDFKIAKKTQDATEEEVQATLQTVRNSKAKYLDKDGVAEAGDRVEVDFEVSLDDKVLDGGVSKNHPIIIGSKSFIPGFEESLVGMSKGEDKKFSLVTPKDYYKKDIAGKKLDFVVRLNDIKKVELPELSDELARSLGQFENVLALKKSIKEGIIKEKETKEQQRVRLEILEAIIKRSDMTVPEDMIDKQLDIMIQNFDEELHSSGMELGLYLAHINKTQDDLRKDWRKNAERQVQIVLVLHKIARTNNIVVDDAELEQVLGQTMQSIASGGVDRKNIDSLAVKKNIRDRMMNEKTLTFLEEAYLA
ncbi:MAG: trigger factor [Candidatus Yanofskybacteria bacterium RIFOXYD1_FULL_44_17]|uniref:Trigger factor n=1 Tax=Candidatus Yanofskybacteria bacterium GW2011_GWE2_40_11 TaxID=1619033 RepID=A0A0G0QTG9_9BACT|nr:MAG: Trigger factor [Candidatus Yanofskybacteria bacterium GW2011_GWE2_40_11]OGN37028.1 MAG: trigger factor [Candidatus Yanofskybacteria bacterium RIFOXYA2_FULL_45_28]OGN37035.1 MAG: trigger factor [Candidatus Yanofskybacteria bacterium RIFOXYB2_FULL_44_18]OGN37253.1 MAG: trigger factor [Candidatus Yanofskybacteria bacterium RIFOXYB1_FULL_44_29]OGN39078.1 MAG: trigger factor [Candidatus Yanofskybacteria bacterium RIFOXYC1_FULL_44_16]OGN39377.1 MAG: trigger factor [Candidatus Yanofskybacteri